MFASLLPTAVGFLMLPIYTRYLTPADYGVLALVLSLQSFLPLVMTLQIPSSINRFYFDYQNDRDKLNVFISTILYFTIVVSVTVGSIILLNIDNIMSVVFPKTTGYGSIFFLGVLSSFFNVITTVFVSLLRVQQKAKILMTISLCLFVFSFLVNILEVIFFERGAYGVIEGYLISSIVTAIVYCIAIREFIVFRFKLELIIEPLKFSIPLIPHALSGLVFMYSDRIILEKHVTLSVIGIYMFSDKIAMVFKMLANEFNNAFSPYFNQLANKSKQRAIDETQTISLIFVYIVAMLISFSAVFSVEIVYILFDEVYFESWKIIPLLSLAYLFRSLYCFASSGLFYAKKTNRVAIITLIAGVVNIALNLWFIPTYGIIAAVYSTVASFAISYLLAGLLSHRVYYLKLYTVKHFIVIGYVIITIVISQWFNANFHSFGIESYIYKIIVIATGVFLGYKINVMNFHFLKKIRT